MRMRFSVHTAGEENLSVDNKSCKNTHHQRRECDCSRNGTSARPCWQRVEISHYGDQNKKYWYAKNLTKQSADRLNAGSVSVICKFKTSSAPQPELVEQKH